MEYLYLDYLMIVIKQKRHDKKRKDDKKRKHDEYKLSSLCKVFI